MPGPIALKLRLLRQEWSVAPLERSAPTAPFGASEYAHQEERLPF